MRAALVDKSDYFGDDCGGEYYRSLPQVLCICCECLFANLTSASFVNLRAIQNGRTITDIQTLPVDERPKKCRLCGRYVADPAPVKEDPAAVEPKETAPLPTRLQ